MEPVSQICSRDKYLHLFRVNHRKMSSLCHPSGSLTLRLYRNVKLDSVEKSAEKDLLIEDTSGASSEMVKKVKNKAEYTAGLQAYTVRTLNKQYLTRRI